MGRSKISDFQLGEEMPFCPVCKTPYPEGQIACPHCSKAISRRKLPWELSWSQIQMQAEQRLVRGPNGDIVGVLCGCCNGQGDFDGKPCVWCHGRGWRSSLDF
jgi:hypothetical protein